MLTRSNTFLTGLIGSGIHMSLSPPRSANAYPPSDGAAARHERAARAGLLYDRDTLGGEMLQAFTATRGRVFFELLERRGGYAGYGAANSPIRMAAQRT